MQKRFTPIMPDQVTKFRAEAAAAGVAVPDGNAGTITDAKDHVTLTFVYDGTNLDLTITDKPWYAPASTIWDALSGYLH